MYKMSACLHFVKRSLFGLVQIHVLRMSRYLYSIDVRSKGAMDSPGSSTMKSRLSSTRQPMALLEPCACQYLFSGSLL